MYANDYRFGAHERKQFWTKVTFPISVSSVCDPTSDDIRAFCEERLVPYEIPRLVEFRESLPKTLVGKVLGKALVEEHKLSTDQSGKSGAG